MADPRVIDVFLAFAPGDRNTWTPKVDGKPGKPKLLPGPDWKGLVASVSKTAFKLNVTGPSYKPNVADLKASLGSSEVTILVGHGAGSMQGQKWVSNEIKLSDGWIVSPKGLSEGTWNGNVFTPADPAAKPVKLKTNKVTGVFTCNSHDTLPQAFDVPAGNTIVTNDGGKDGLTRVGVLEKASFAFVKEYVATKGDVGKATAKAQVEFNNSKVAGDQDDKILMDTTKQP